jgi:hypothetical protein
VHSGCKSCAHLSRSRESDSFPVGFRSTATRRVCR